MEHQDQKISSQSYEVLKNLEHTTLSRLGSINLSHIWLIRGTGPIQSKTHHIVKMQGSDSILHQCSREAMSLLQLTLSSSQKYASWNTCSVLQHAQFASEILQKVWKSAALTVHKKQIFSCALSVFDLVRCQNILKNRTSSIQKSTLTSQIMTFSSLTTWISLC